jgi:hypothetical protein
MRFAITLTLFFCSCGIAGQEPGQQGRENVKPAFGGFGLVRATIWLWLDWARFGPNLACFGLGSARVGLVFVASWPGWARLWLALMRLYKRSDALEKGETTYSCFRL